MKQKNKAILAILAMVLVFIGIGGTKYVVEMKQSEQKERQIAFLKSHEKEMTDYVKKSESEKVSKVDYIWDTVKVGQGMAFTKKGLSIKVNIFDKNGKKINGFWINIFVDDVRDPKSIEGIN